MAMNQKREYAPECDLSIDVLGGNCPVQGEGEVCGRPFHFWARGSSWTFEVEGEDGRAWTAEERWGTWPNAGWMTVEQARGLIDGAARLYAEHLRGEADLSAGEREARRLEREAALQEARADTFLADDMGGHRKSWLSEIVAERLRATAAEGRRAAFAARFPEAPPPPSVEGAEHAAHAHWPSTSPLLEGAAEGRHPTQALCVILHRLVSDPSGFDAPRASALAEGLSAAGEVRTRGNPALAAWEEGISSLHIQHLPASLAALEAAAATPGAAAFVRELRESAGIRPPRPDHGLG